MKWTSGFHTSDKLILGRWELIKLFFTGTLRQDWISITLHVKGWRKAA